jgi:hypothetical protein
MCVDVSHVSYAGTNFSGHPDQVILGTTLGVIIGAKISMLKDASSLSDLTGVLFSRLMRYAHRKGFIDRESYIAQYIALALFTVGVTNSLGNDDLLAAFAAGVFAPRPCCALLLIHAYRQCDLLGWPFQRTDRRRFILHHPRSCPQLRLLYLYRSVASVRSISYP